VEYPFPARNIYPVTCDLAAGEIQVAAKDISELKATMKARFVQASPENVVIAGVVAYEIPGGAGFFTEPPSGQIPRHHDKLR
jgi:hypothetical protein